MEVVTHCYYCRDWWEEGPTGGIASHQRGEFWVTCCRSSSISSFPLHPVKVMGGAGALKWNKGEAQGRRRAKDDGRAVMWYHYTMSSLIYRCRSGRDVTLWWPASTICLSCTHACTHSSWHEHAWHSTKTHEISKCSFWKAEEETQEKCIRDPTSDVTEMSSESAAYKAEQQQTNSYQFHLYSIFKTTGVKPKCIPVKENVLTYEDTKTRITLHYNK